MKLVVRYSALARNDLVLIRQWTLKKFSPNQANDYLTGLQLSLLRIAQTPNIARNASPIRVGLFKVVAGSHIAFFRLTTNSLDVVRILHGSMDFEQWL